MLVILTIYLFCKLFYTIPSHSEHDWMGCKQRDIVFMLHVKWEITIFLNKQYFVMAGNWAETRSTIWNMIKNTDIWTTNFVL